MDERIMDIQAYISSGILELYLSGQLESVEAQEVERLANEHPEIRAELDALEAAIGQFAGELYDSTPSSGLLDNIMGAIAEADATQVVTSPPIQSPIDTETPLLPLTASKSPANWRWIAVAAAVALLISLAFNFQQYGALRQVNDQLATLNQQQQQFSDQIDRTASQIEVLADANSRIIDLKGLDLAPNSKARVYWNTASNKVYFRMDGLPKLTEEQQYQLWAIIDGVPVDAGVLLADGSLELANPISGDAIAFAVTIEPKGGSTNPTMDKMVLYGEA
ncbi:MAG: anti-sigma factor [Bacteroidia bacterium]